MKFGEYIMGKLKKVILVVIFPITIIFFLFRKIFKVIENKRLHKYFENLDIREIDALDGHAFEELLYYLFKSMGLKVTKTKASRDYGADLIISGKDKKAVVQCKLYYNHSVGNSAIQEIATAKEYYNAEIGIVVTNSFFTKPAITMANKIDIKLIDRDNLVNLLKNSKDKRKLNSMLI